MTASESSRSSWRGVALSALAATICVVFGSYVVWTALGRPHAGIDDANIFFVYARNIDRGHGIVYDVGGEHVEGYTSMLYVMLCSLVFWLSRAPEQMLFLLNTLFAALTSTCLMLVLMQLAESLELGRRGKVLFCGAYLVWLLANPAYFAWSVVTLMDSGVYSLMLTAGYALLALLLLRKTHIRPGHGWLLGVIAALCIVARPEGIGWALLQTFAFACLCWAQSKSWRVTLRLTSLPLGATVVTYAALVGFRELYFGYPLPNTFYAKVSSSLLLTLAYGEDSAKFFIQQYGFAFFAPACVFAIWVVCALLRRRKMGRLLWFGALTTLFAATGMLMPIVEGGDHFGASRMFQNIYPLLGVTLLLPLLPFGKARQLRFNAAYIVCLGALIALTTTVTYRSFRIANEPSQPGLPHAAVTRRLDMHLDFSLVGIGQRDGERMNSVFRGDYPSIGVAAAGGIAYTYQGTVYDLLGLNDSRMAHADKLKTGPKDHASFSAKVFYDIAPDILQPKTTSADIRVDLQARRATNRNADDFDNEIFRDIFQEDRFRAMYILAVVRNPADPSVVIYGYFRRARLQDLVTRHGIQIVDSLAL